MPRGFVPVDSVPRDGGGGIPTPPVPVDLRLDGNQGSTPPPELLATATDPELLRAYPSGADLEQAIAARFGVAPERVVVGAGADELLDRICRLALAPGREIVLPVPTFEMLARHARLAGGTIRSVPWHDGPWPLAAVRAALTPATALVAVVSPNNPTGLVATAADVAAVTAAAPAALVAVDTAYAEYGDEDLAAAALAVDNAVLLRTFSKAWGLAGLRVGYAIAQPAVAGWLRAIGSPFPCGRLARHLAGRRFAAGEAAMRAHVAAVRAERAGLTQWLAAVGARAGAVPVPGQGNFVFVRTPDPLLLRDGLLGLGIAVRAFDFGGTAPPGVRITMPGSAAHFARLRGALAAVLAPAAAVLDLDGVLADIEGRRPLVAPAVLAALAARVPVAVVTGCPRRLAESVLERHGLLPHVRVVVAAEDAPDKPDPAPVRLALARLGAASAWMLGDNPVDVAAARAAGVVPFAIAPQGIGAEAHAADLRAAGAGRLLPDLAAFAALLATVVPA